MATIKEVTQYLESFAPRSWQENWDNAGLNVGNPDWEVKGILLALDFTPDVIDEAIEIGANLIITHHPILFKKLIRNLTGASNLEATIIKAIKNDIALYSMHTNLDFWIYGINRRIAELLGLKNLKIFDSLRGKLKKLVTFVPEAYVQKVREAIFKAGAGVIGNYDWCSFNAKGYGTFRAQPGTHPFVGEIGKLHEEPEVRVETIFPEHLTSKIIKALLDSHPYEEVAYDIYPLDNEYPIAGTGLSGEFEEPMDEREFLELVANKVDIPVLKHSRFIGRPIKKVVICTGGCGFLVEKVIASGADAFLLGDSDYHNFFTAQDKLLMVEAGHYETEKFAIDIFYDLLTEKFNTFAIRKISKNYNFVNYFVNKSHV